MRLTGSVITTFRCNAHCHMCHIWRYPSDPAAEIGPEVMSRLPDGLWRINITGGEPMLREDIQEIVDVLYPKTRVLEISTNGYYTEPLVKIAQRHPDVLIRVSAEGLPAANDRLRGIKDGFDHALRSVLALKRVGAKNIGFSVVICDQNAPELLPLYDLCAGLGIELGNATMHNSWYFHKHDNRIDDASTTGRWVREFMLRLLTSPRSDLRARAKDWLRAYFMRSITRKVEGETGFRPPCVAGTDMFFLDPWGNILPCNGSDEPWVMGNLVERSFDEIWHSETARQVRERVRICDKTCCFVATERVDMVKRPWKPIAWIAENKLRVALGRKPCLE